ncbi:conserved hypothetical protein [Ricinus communis]|uniref:Reverse transcriptase zinc-binding domain-containing protein n=1 Tax=Ricinus communis TaxID=3988 RepID=B9T7J5_RICCO|nr:conserved hypothetical protein [Ricinus communis]
MVDQSTSGVTTRFQTFWTWPKLRMIKGVMMFKLWHTLLVMIAWNGIYSVRSRYKAPIHLEDSYVGGCVPAAQSIRSSSSREWNNIWQLPIIAKVKDFIWRCSRNA